MSPAPPPPPPPANLPNFSTSATNSKPSTTPNTSALLKSIEKGKKLKKTVTNDRSAPLVSNQRNSAAPNKQSEESAARSSNTTSNNSAVLGGLFANGFPNLRSTKQTSDRPLPKPMSEAMPVVLKTPANDFAHSGAESIVRDPEKAFNIVKKGVHIVAPAIISGTITQPGKKHISAEISNSVRATGNKINHVPSDAALSNKGKMERWHFTIKSEENLPNPGKYSGCKKIYISETINTSDKLSKLVIGEEVTESNIMGFIKTLKSKIDKAARKEDFEECVRLKSKLKSFEEIEKRIKAGEQISVTELPI